MNRRFQKGLIYPIKLTRKSAVPSEPYLIVASFFAVLVTYALLLTLPGF
jgi:trk system potassium uptake protein TrkH